MKKIEINFSEAPEILFSNEKFLMLSSFHVSLMAEDLPKEVFLPELSSILSNLVIKNNFKLTYLVQGLSFDLGLGNDFDSSALAFICSENGISSMLSLSNDTINEIILNVYHSLDGKRLFCETGFHFGKKEISHLQNLNLITKDKVKDYFLIDGIDVDFLVNFLQKTVLQNLNGRFGLEFDF